MKSENLKHFFQEFVEPEDFLCPLCLSLVYEPVEKLCCSELFCKGCYDEYAEETCPYCRSDEGGLREVKGRIADMLGNVDCECPFCEEELKYRNISDHYGTCQLRLIECECEQMVEKAIHEEHKKYDCEKRLIECLCKNEVIYEELKDSSIKKIIIDCEYSLVGEEVIKNGILYSIIRNEQEPSSCQMDIIGIEILTGEYTTKEFTMNSYLASGNIEKSKIEEFNEGIAFICYGEIYEGHYSSCEHPNSCGEWLAKVVNNEEKYEFFVQKLDKYGEEGITDIETLNEFECVNIRGQYDEKEQNWNIINVTNGKTSIIENTYVGQFDHYAIFVNKNSHHITLIIVDCSQYLCD